MIIIIMMMVMMTAAATTAMTIMCFCWCFEWCKPLCVDHARYVGEMLGDHGDVDKSKPWEGSAHVPLMCAG